MDLRTLPADLTPSQRVAERRARIERELEVDLSCTQVDDRLVGHAEEKNCEQMFGHVPVPVGYAGPLEVMFTSSGERASLHLPLATTEGALVASVNRGCKALTRSDGVRTSSLYPGATRSLAFRTVDARTFIRSLHEHKTEWMRIAEATSNHLKILSFDIDELDDYVFLTLHADTGDAMGMNMITIAAQAVGEWIGGEQKMAEFVTVAANVDSDKKPSIRTLQQGRGYDVTAEATLSEGTISDVLKSSSKAMLSVYDAKLNAGADVAGAIGRNLHAANIVAALFLATGQDAAHVVEGSLATTTVEQADDGLRVFVRLPAVMVGVRGGGTTLPAQKQCLDLLMRDRTTLPSRQQLAESIGAAVLAGEVSLLAAQASQTLAKAHKEHGR